MNFRITFKFFFNPIYGVPTIIKQGEECFSPPSQNGTMPNQGFETEELYFSPTNPELRNKFSQETTGTEDLIIIDSEAQSFISTLLHDFS